VTGRKARVRGLWYNDIMRDGGQLTGLWWPRLEWVSVPAHRRYFERATD